jgi:hypothetical protein
MIQVFSHSETGGHAENEDAFVAQPHPSDPDSYLCAIADGQGGRAGGGRAARLARDCSLEAASAVAPADFISPATWVSVLRKADQAVATDPVAGFTTLIGFCVARGFICGASNGDSAVAMLNSSKQGQILTARQRKNPPVGSGGAEFVPFHAQLQPPWLVLAMTDGVWKYTGWDTIFLAASQDSGEGIIRSLLERARLPRSGKLQDDFTLLVLSDE